MKKNFAFTLAEAKPSRGTREVRDELASTKTVAEPHQYTKFWQKLLDAGQCSFCCKSERCRLMRGAVHAFTLAEVLITITIIGVVAAMTIPNLLTDINQRKYNSMSGNFQRKLGEALRVMNGQNTLKGHTTTLSFVNELSKNFKTVKICSKVEECFPAKFKKDDGTLVDVSTLTDSTALGSNYGTETVGVQFVNGVRAIIAYNPNFKLQTNKDVVDFQKDDTNKTVKMRTNVLTMLYDVSEDDNNTIDEDILSLNTIFSKADITCDKIGSYYCIKDLGQSKSVTCAYEDMNQDFCKPTRSGFGNDHWAGAKKMCKDIGMELASKEDLDRLYHLRQEGIEGADTIPSTGSYWSSSESAEDTQKKAYALNLSNGSIAMYNYSLKQQQYGVLCVK